eukprot:3713710-Prymnesium_polylepis.1
MRGTHGDGGTHEERLGCRVWNRRAADRQRVGQRESIGGGRKAGLRRRVRVGQIKRREEGRV